MTGVKILHVAFIWCNKQPWGIMQLTQFEAFNIPGFSKERLLQETLLLKAEPDPIRHAAHLYF